MKKILLILMVFATFTACKQAVNVETKLADTFLSGKIDNKLDEIISISGSEVAEKIQVDADGNFSDTLQLPVGYYRLRNGKKSVHIYIEPGYSLKLAVDMEDYLASLNFSGIGAENNNFIFEKIKHNGEILLPVKELYALEETDFLAEISKVRASSQEFLTAAAVSPKFQEHEAKNIRYEYLKAIYNYPRYHKYFAKKDTVILSPDFMEPLEGFDYDNDEDFNIFENYRHIATEHEMGWLDDHDTDSFIERLKGLKSPALRNALLGKLAYFVSPGDEESEKIYQSIMAMSTDEELKEKLTKKHELIKNLIKGKPSPQFVYQDVNGKDISMSDLKGKNVYIDVWATWCGPCKAEIPYLKEMEKAHHGKNIEFVSISIDQQKDIEKWKKMVEDKELKGVQVISDKDWKSDFVQSYAIEGIPRFIMVNAEGNIVSADAPRPSAKDELLALFDEAGVN